MSLLDIKGSSREHLPTSIYETPEEASKVVALEIAKLIKERRKKSKIAVLGLTTRITPKLIYKELVIYLVIQTQVIFVVKSRHRVFCQTRAGKHQTAVFAQK